MNVLLDRNVVLDVLLVRQPWLTEAARVWDAYSNGQIAAAIAAFTAPTVFYVLRRQTDLRRIGAIQNFGRTLE
jgi:predicted nucleic acid-binding protein